MTFLSWNIHKMKTKRPAPGFVTDLLVQKSPDVICLVEYIADAGIRQALQENYHIAESVPLSGNQVLIAVKKTLTDSLTVVDDKEIQGCWNFLHVSFTAADGVTYSVLGVRRVVGRGAAAVDDQVPPLLSRLKALDMPFLCAGDFNIVDHRMETWFPGIQKAKLTGRPYYSYIFTDRKTHEVTDTRALDHLLCSDDLNAAAHYEWDFTGLDPVYAAFPPNIGQVWRIPAAHPDHAMLLAEIQKRAAI